MSESEKILSEAKARRLCEELLKAYGASEAEAKTVAEVLVAGSLRGVDSHGLQLLPRYLIRIERGLVKPGAEVRILRDGPATALIDGGWGFGAVVGKRAMELAIEKADRCGIGAVGVRRVDHFGIAAYYAMMASDRGMIGIVTANASPGIAPTGGMRPALGTNPIAIAIPAGRHRPIVVDMATAAIPKNKLLLAAKKGERIPSGLALDSEGRPTTDPAEALKGAILPAAGPKGYGLAVAVDALSGALTGSACALDVISIGNSMTEPPTIGNFFMAIRIDAFLPLEEFKAKIDKMIEDIKRVPRAPGVQEILMPGEPEFRTADRRAKEGIPIDGETWRQLKDLAAQKGMDLEALAA